MIPAGHGIRRCGAAVICLLMTAGAARRPAVQDFRSPVETNLTTPSGSRGVMVRPPGPGPFPAILHLHGSGERASEQLGILRLFANAGYMALDVDYRDAGPNRIDIYPNAGHNDLPWEKVYSEVLSFFQTHLHGRPAR